MEGALFYPSVKRSPCAFGFCVRLVCAGCLRGKNRLLFLLAFKRKRFIFLFGLGFNRGKWIFNDYLPAHSRGEPSSFPVAEKNQNATAASDAMKGSAKARVVIAAPANAEQRLGRVCEWTICSRFKFDFLYQIF